MVGYFVKVPNRTAMTGQNVAGIRPVLASNVLHARRPTGAEREHNAAKPVDLLVDILSKHGDHAQVVLDPFAGSGSTLIACAELGRRCLAVDVKPQECDKIRRRWTRWARARERDPGPGLLEESGS